GRVTKQEQAAAATYGAWNPGLESELPRQYLPLATIFRPENVSTSAAKAYELRDTCGLPAHDLVAFRPERLAVHELLVRVTSSLAVPNGPDYEDLGRNFRRIASTILDKYIAPHRAGLTELFERTRNAALAFLVHELEASLWTHVAPATEADQPSGGRWTHWFAKPKQAPSRPVESAAERD